MDVLEGLRTLPDSSVHVCITSPPYWGLRNYGIPPRKWEDGSESVFGLEPSKDLYVGHSVEIFREVRRVLHPSGTLWLNIGDCYDHAGPQPSTGVHKKNGVPLPETFKRAKSGRSKKNLAMIPARVALALQDDDWVLRNDIIWAKGLSFCSSYSGSVMPESIVDRAIWSHEHLYHFAKNPKYFYDIEGCREPYAETTRTQALAAYEGKSRKDYKSQGVQDPSDVKRRVLSGVIGGGGRNLRNVWVIPKEPLKEAHFACVDTETECLTNRGWRRLEDLSYDDKVAQLDIPTDHLFWGKLKGVNQYDVCDQEMVTAQSRDVDFMVTPNHRCLSKPLRAKGNFSVVEATNLATSSTIPTAAPWYSSGDSFDPAVAELIGWYAAEGHEEGEKVGISQSEAVNPTKVARIESLLQSIGADYKRYHQKREWRGRSADMATFKIKGRWAGYLQGFAPKKRLPLSILNWSPTCLAALLKGFNEGDGHTRKDGRFCISQKDEYTIDLLQAAGVRLGYTTCKSKNGTQFVLYFTKRSSRGLRGTNGQASILKTQLYSGVVWCPHTESGTWVARRNGRVFITGNSFPTKLVEPPIRLGSSEKGCCPSCFNPYERVTTRERVPDDIQAAFNASRITTTADTGRTDGYTHRKPNYRRRLLGEGWRPTCACEAGDPIPTTVLDPFCGSGRAGVVAKRLGRSFIGIEASATYCEIARRVIDAA